VAEYFKQVWQVNRSMGWILLGNILLLVLVSLGFTGHFPEAFSTLDTLYQIGLLPAVWGLYAVLAIISLAPLSFIPALRYGLMFLLASAGGTLAVIVFIDSYIYDIFNYHINWFFISTFFADEGGEFFDISLKTYFLFSFVAFLIVIAELALLWVVEKKIITRRHFKFAGVAAGLLVFANVLFVNVTHSWAYAQNYMPITSISGHVPFYFPIHSRKLAKNDALAGMSDDTNRVESNIYYPKNPMQCEPGDEKPNVVMVVLESWRGDTVSAEVTPNTYKLAQESQWFKEYHSSGTVTTKGIFSLMYGLAPTYMDNVVANNGAGGPVLLNLMKDQGYDFGIYSSGDIERIKIADTSFVAVKDDIQHGEGKDTIEKDYDVLNKMVTKLKTSNDPVFGFMFFNSSHYLYYYPEGFVKFLPVEEPSLVDFKAGKNPEPYINRYKNSLHFNDHLIGKLIDELKAMGKWENTIFIVTSDHAEEFAHTGPTRFGHGSNYTRHQSHVPMVIHWPGKKPEQFTHRATSLDVTPTILKDAFKCSNDITDYSNGNNLFDRQSHEVQVMSSYYNYALVTEQGSFIQNPIGLIESKDNDDKLDPDLKLAPGQAFKALQQMQHFYKKN
jgi:membrane-anchored protein YejM (alkaline phosphatase superfamily)